MAKKTAGFPRLPERQWWAIRERFKQSIPSKVTSNYLATVLNMKEASAKANILPALEAVGLIDAEGMPTGMATRWRDDVEYPEVVKEMREAIYPDELLDAIPDPGNNRDGAERWFANRTGHGGGAATKMAQLYDLLSDGDPTRGQAKVQPKPKASKTTSPRLARSAPRVSTPTKEQESASVSPKPGRDSERSSGGPTLHIDVQIHISPEASPEQIDQIFASMAKHIYNQ
jgi:hypothetical protein